MDKNVFINKAKTTHGEIYDYSLIPKTWNSKDKLPIKCPIHGVFYQRYDHHLHGHGCPMCAGNEKMNKEQFIEKAKAVHGNKYDYSKVDYVNNRTPVIVICSIHGEFQQTPSNHLKGQGCPTCAYSSPRNKKWTYDTCKKEALKYKSITDFQKNSAGAYRVALDNGWVDDFFIRLQHKNWSDEEIINEAFKYNSRSEFSKNCKGAYKAALRKGLMDNLSNLNNNLISKKETDKIYRYVFPDLTIYIGRTIQHVQSRDYQHIFVKRDPIRRYAEQMKFPIPKMEIMENGLSVSQGVEREKYWISFYKKLGYTLLNTMPGGAIGSIGGRIWNEEQCYIAAQECSTSSEFKTKYPSAYQASCRHGWLKKYTWFVRKMKPSRYYLNIENIKKEIDDYQITSISALQKHNSAIVHNIRKLGIIDILFPNRKKIGIWNYETCYAEAQKYHSRTKFSKGNHRAYCVALKNEWIDDYDWFDKKPKFNYWCVYNNCKEEAAKYQTRNQFHDSNRRAYDASSKNGWLDEFFPK